MHKVNTRTYVGQPNEAVTVSTQPGGGGQASVFVNGQNVGAVAQFSLPSTPAQSVTVHVVLAGPIGATCVVTIASVDGGTDGDFLMCLASDPVPSNFYTMSVAASSAVDALAAARAPLAPPKPEAAAKKPAAKSPRRKGAAKRGANKKGGRR